VAIFVYAGTPRTNLRRSRASLLTDALTTRLLELPACDTECDTAETFCALRKQRCARFHVGKPKACWAFWSLWVSKRIFLRRTDRQFRSIRSRGPAPRPGTTVAPTDEARRLLLGFDCRRACFRSKLEDVSSRAPHDPPAQALTLTCSCYPKENFKCRYLEPFFRYGWF
jgi:hypothetical protein